MKLVMATLVLLVASSASAESARSEEQATEYRFEDDLIRGDLVRPDAEVLHARRGAGQASLVEVRMSFVRELVSCVEDL